jgi:hypothetical protein
MLNLPWHNDAAPNRGRTSTRLAAALAVACLWFLAAKADAATFTASLDRNSITLGESVTLSLTFTGGGPQNTPNPPAIPNLQITYSGQSSQFIIGSQTTSSLTHNFTVTPRQAGDFIIPAITADVGGQKLASQPLILKVAKPGAPSPDAIKSGSQVAFLKLVVPKLQVYVGEVITAELQLHLQNTLRNAGNFQITSLPADGFSAGKMAQGSQRQAQVGSSVYNVVPLTFPLTPVKTGSFTVGPVTATIVVVVPSPNRSRDPFMDIFGGGEEQRQLALATDPVTVQILPLPSENVPASFNGAVGNYRMSVSAGPTNVAVGDPITVRVQISGNGALDSVTLPEQAAWRDFKAYPQTAKVETTDPLGLDGTKTFEQLLAPQTSDLKALPPVVFSFFDPAAKAYRTLNSPALPLAVKPSGSSAGPSILAPSAKAQDAPPSQDIVPNKQRLGAVAQIGPPLIQQRWFLALQCVPVLAWISALVWRRRTDSLANNPRLRRQRQVARVVRAGLEQLRQLAAEKKTDEFFATLFHLLQEQLGERLDLPASAITEAVIDERLRPAKVQESTIAPLHELFQTCNLARYAPVQTSQELTAIILKLESTLQALRELAL